MAYVSPNIKSKAALKRAIAASERVTVYQPGGMFPLTVTNGRVSVEGPHYPAPHSWYAVVAVDENNRVTRVIS